MNKSFKNKLSLQWIAIELDTIITKCSRCFSIRCYSNEAIESVNIVVRNANAAEIFTHEIRCEWAKLVTGNVWIGVNVLLLFNQTNHMWFIPQKQCLRRRNNTWALIDWSYTYRRRCGLLIRVLDRQYFLKSRRMTCQFSLANTNNFETFSIYYGVERPVIACCWCWYIYEPQITFQIKYLRWIDSERTYAH